MTLLLFPFHAELRAFMGSHVETSERRVRGYRMVEMTESSPWILAVCGQGKAEAALACAILGEALRPDRIWLVGSAAALVPDLQPGEIVAADECLEIYFRSTGEAGENPPPRFRPTGKFPAAVLTFGLRIGRILSADADCFDPEIKRQLGKQYHALAYAWEGAGFHRALRRMELPGMEIRVITEGVDDTRSSLEMLQGRLRSASPRLREILRHLEGMDQDQVNPRQAD